jgi:hypothetical protein
LTTPIGCDFVDGTPRTEVRLKGGRDGTDETDLVPGFRDKAW